MLYFAYSATLDPELLSSIAPNAKFLYIAHLPEAKLVFPTPDGRPSVRPAAGNTVWGAIFEVNAKESAIIEKAEAGEGRDSPQRPAGSGPGRQQIRGRHVLPRQPRGRSHPRSRSTWSRSSGVPVIGAFRPAGWRDWKTSAKTP